MNSKTRRIYNRKHRHRENAKLKNRKAVRAHREISGRTGLILAKRTPSSKCWSMIWRVPNPPFWASYKAAGL